jgi:hypothetical protein
MKLTPALKGQLTKAIKANGKTHSTVRSFFMKFMPKEQAKHATRKYLAQKGN